MYQGKIEPNQKKKFEVEKPFSGYGFTLTIGGTLAKTGKKSMQENRAYFLLFLEELSAQTTISVTYSYKDGNPLRPIAQMQLLPILEYAQNEEGVIMIEESGEPDAPILTMKAYLPLTKDGNILFNNDEIMTLDLTTGEDVAIDVHTIESAIAAPDFNSFQNLDVLQGKKDVEFDVSKYASIMVPMKAMSVNTELSIEFTNGKVCRYFKPELEYIGLLVNDICFVNPVGFQINGFGLYAILDTSTVKNIRINRDTISSFTIIAIERVVVKNVNNVIAENSGMLDLTSLKLDREIVASQGRF